MDRERKKIVEVCDFDDMGLCYQLLRGIYLFGYEKPSLIQQDNMPIVLTGIFVCFLSFLSFSVFLIMNKVLFIIFLNKLIN